LALTRAERKKLERGDMLVDVDRLLDGLARKSRVEARVARKRSPMGLVLKDWGVDKPRLRSMIHGGHLLSCIARESVCTKFLCR